MTIHIKEEKLRELLRKIGLAGQRACEKKDINAATNLAVIAKFLLEQLKEVKGGDAIVGGKTVDELIDVGDKGIAMAEVLGERYFNRPVH